MARICKFLGAVLLVLGLITAATFTTRILRDEDYAKKQLIASRNPSNDVYKLEFGAAQVRRGFDVAFLSGGALLGVQGVTLLLLGIVSSRVRDIEK